MESYHKQLELALSNGILAKKTIEGLLEETLNMLLRLERSEYLKGQAEYNKANGYYERKTRNLAGVFQLRVPRDRKGLFKPFLLEIMRREQEDLDRLLMGLYSCGVSVRDTQILLKELYGESYSPSKISSLAKRFQAEREVWEQRTLEKNWHIVMLDAVHINVRRDRVEKEAFLVVIGVKEDFTREVLGLYNVPSESSSAWGDVLQDLKNRGLENVGLVVTDELSGMCNAVHQAFPRARHQLCLVHKIRGLMKRVRASKKKELLADFKEVFQLDNEQDSIAEIASRLELFLDKWTKHYPKIAAQLKLENLPRYCAYIAYPVVVRRMIYTTNWIERLNKEIRKTTRHAGSFPSPDSALNLIFATVMKTQERAYGRKLYNTGSLEVQNAMNKILESSIS